MSAPEVATGDPAADRLLAQCARIIAIQEHLRMDTAENEDLRKRGVEIAKTALFNAAEVFAARMADPADVDALVQLTLRELEADLPGDLVPRRVARKAVEVTLRAVTEAPDETQAAVAASYAKGRSDGYLACRAGVPDPTEEDQ